MEVQLLTPYPFAPYALQIQIQRRLDDDHPAFHLYLHEALSIMDGGAL